ncbi:aromatic ring-opening dioxygenase catalytic subunit (LigB family) [Arthrobacter ginsengisoli]|uniref:Aromatic ring-opening dioxygenase catalytic subunit (LigB family) n=1 Tax=Arthrobacter ginsengisoli TaxID=1356565 RepID=A0ABU1U7A8_9MICC|nr:aromatic ring-opening dioxygenase catalytic subunit (LigB family) [Arthrobacter ginsengisoli]
MRGQVAWHCGQKALAAREVHPRSEHCAPLYVALGAAYESGDLHAKTAIDGWFGLSKRSWTLT